MLKDSCQRLILFFGVCLLSVAAQAIVVEHLYEAEVPFETRGKNERGDLIQQNLSHVLTKVSGDLTITQNEKIRNILPQAGNYIEQYAYQDGVFQAKFSSSLINNLLYDVGAPVWSKNRPMVILWLAIEQQGMRALVGGEKNIAIQQQLQTYANTRGLPLLLPLLDLEDVGSVTVTDVWSHFPSVLQAASMRYASDAILVGRLVHRSSEDMKGVWEGRWQLVVEDKTYTWFSEEGEIEPVLQMGIDGVIQQMVDLYAVRETFANQETVRVGVQNVQSAGEYEKVLSYLEGLANVKEVQIVQLYPDAILFDIKLMGVGGQHALKQSIELDQNLFRLSSSKNQLLEAELLYRWTP